jgi:type I restriction enzyme, S subunit
MRWLLASKTGLAQQHLNVSAVKRTLVPLPPLEEQQDIVDILTAVDCKIAVEGSRKASLEMLFKTLLHNLMTGKVRVPDVDLAEIEEVV